MNDKRIELLKNKPIKEAINKMSIPAVIGLIVMAVYSIVDTMFVSWISTEATAATQVVFPLMIVASAIGLTFGIGAGSYISRLLGKNDYKKAHVVSSTAFYSALVVGIFVTILGFIFSTEIFTFFGANDDIIELTELYGKYITIGYSISILNMVMNNLLRAEGSAKYSMIGMLIGSVLNIILDPIFIFTFGWGIAGAAIATTLSQIVTLIILIVVYLKGKTVLKINPKDFRFDLEIYKKIFVVGIPTFFKQLLVAISFALINQASIRYGGTDLLAAMGIIIKVSILPINIIFGYGQGFQPVAGYNYGAKNYSRVMESFKYTMFISSLVAIITFVIFNVFGYIVFDIFNSSPEVTELGIRGLRLYSIGILFLGVSNTITMFYSTLGKGREAMLLSVSRQGIFFIPAILVLPQLIGLDGVLIAQSIADILAFLLSGIMFYLFIKSSEEFKSLKKNND